MITQPRPTRELVPRPTREVVPRHLQLVGALPIHAGRLGALVVPHPIPRHE
jgi:hypothetical protein